MATKTCNCLTHGGRKSCIGDFNCKKCGECLYWKGYEEGTEFCSYKCKMEQQLKKELTELFGDGENGEAKVYFRDTDEDSAVMERFKDKENDYVICFIVCWGSKHLDYFDCYGGSDELVRINKKYTCGS